MSLSYSKHIEHPGSYSMPNATFSSHIGSLQSRSLVGRENMAESSGVFSIAALPEVTHCVASCKCSKRRCVCPGRSGNVLAVRGAAGRGQSAKFEVANSVRGREFLQGL